jgi:hypothetical protein
MRSKMGSQSSILMTHKIKALAGSRCQRSQTGSQRPYPPFRMPRPLFTARKSVPPRGGHAHSRRRPMLCRPNLTTPAP